MVKNQLFWPGMGQKIAQGPLAAITDYWCLSRKSNCKEFWSMPYSGILFGNKMEWGVVTCGTSALRPGQLWANQDGSHPSFALGLCMVYSFLPNASSVTLPIYYSIPLPPFLLGHHLCSSMWSGLFVPSQSCSSLCSLQLLLYFSIPLKMSLWPCQALHNSFIWMLSCLSSNYHALQSTLPSFWLLPTLTCLLSECQ